MLSISKFNTSTNAAYAQYFAHMRGVVVYTRSRGLELQDSGQPATFLQKKEHALFSGIFKITESGDRMADYVAAINGNMFGGAHHGVIELFESKDDIFASMLSILQLGKICHLDDGFHVFERNKRLWSVHGYTPVSQAPKRVEDLRR